MSNGRGAGGGEPEIPVHELIQYSICTCVDVHNVIQGMYHLHMARWNFTSVQDRFWSKVNRTDGCWSWTAGTYQGYGRFRIGSVGSRNMLAHRVAWEWARGPVPAGMELDHLCRNRACVRPEHLEPVAPDVNKRRQVPNNGKAARTSCKRGHEYTPENTRRHPVRGNRICVTCATTVWGKKRT